MLVHRRVTPSIYSQVTGEYPFIFLGGGRHFESKVSCPRTQQRPRPGFELGPLDPESSALTIRPPRLPHGNRVFYQKNKNKWYMKILRFSSTHTHNAIIFLKFVIILYLCYALSLLPKFVLVYGDDFSVRRHNYKQRAVCLKGRLKCDCTHLI